MPVLPQLILCIAYDDFQPAPKKLACILPARAHPCEHCFLIPRPQEWKSTWGTFQPFTVRTTLCSCNQAQEYPCLIAFSLASEISTNHIILSNILAFESPRESPQGLKVTTLYTSKGKKKKPFFLMIPGSESHCGGWEERLSSGCNIPAVRAAGVGGGGSLYLPWMLIRKNHKIITISRSESA